MLTLSGAMGSKAFFTTITIALAANATLQIHVKMSQPFTLPLLAPVSRHAVRPVSCR